MNYSNYIGRKGEDTVAEFLRSKGYFIAARNFKSAHGEIDVIAENEKFVLFVEVKVRSFDAGYFPNEAVTYAKKQHIIYTAKNYIYKSHTHLIPRFDIAEIIVGEDGKIENGEFNYYKNAFEVKGNEFY